MSEHQQQQPPTTTPPPSATASANPGAGTEPGRPGPRPRIAIQYCTQCKWMLRAAYFAQELLSTFSTDLQEVSLVPSTGGIFTVTIYHIPSETTQAQSGGDAQIQGQVTATQLWDRKTDGGFPEVKVLKSLVRNIVSPGRSLGHTDRALNKGQQGQDPSTSTSPGTPIAAPTPTATSTASNVQGQGQGQADAGAKECEDCR